MASVGRPSIPPSIAKTEDHKVFITQADKVITKSMKELINKSGSEFFYEAFVVSLRNLISENPELKEEIERRLKEEGLELPFYIRG